jgi:hypothetical protein
MKKLINSLMVLALVATTGLMVSCSGSGKSPAGVSKSFIQKLEKGDVDAAYQMLDGTENATAEETQKLKAFLSEGTKEISTKGGIKKIEVVSETISEDGKTAEVTIMLTYGNGETDESTTKLKNSEDGWKIFLGK